jgi:hypothetical protein
MNSSYTAKPAETSGYAEVMQLTKNTIRTRAIAFKWLIIGFSVTGLAVLVFTAIFGWICLLGLLLLPVLLGIFFYLDQRLTNRWRSVVMRVWTRQEVKFGLLIETLNLIPGIPKNTLQGLLESFPALTRRETIPTEMRAPLCWTQDLIGEFQISRMALYAATYAFGALCVAWAVAMASLLPILAFGTMLLTAHGLRALHVSRKFQAHAQLVKRMCAAHKINPPRLADLVKAIDWSGIPKSTRKAWNSQIRMLVNETISQAHGLEAVKK